jgi:hypothetical protein
MTHSNSIPFLAVPSERPPQQKCENKTKGREHDQHKKAKKHRTPMRITAAANENSQWQNQNRRSQKAKKRKEKT